MAAQRVGQTKHFFYEYDDALGVKAQTLALALMATCEGDLFRMAEYLPYQAGMGGDVFAARPVIVRVQDAGLPGDPGGGKTGPPRNGADNSGDPTKSTQSDLIRINPLDANGNWSGADQVRFLFCLEMSEQLMYAYNWNPGDSQGEGLSHWFAQLCYPAISDVEVNDWLAQDPRPDWVNKSKPTDRDDISFGCGLIFLYYLQTQRQLWMPDFLQAGGSGLADHYHRLTKDAADPFVAMNNLLLAHYPKDVQLVNNSPFPLYDATKRKVNFSYAQLTTAGRATPGGSAHVKPFFNCPAKDYSFSWVPHTVARTVTADTVGFGIPDFAWKIQGTPLVSGASNGTVTVPMTVPDPSHPDTPQKSNGTMTFTYSRSDDGTLNSRTSTLAVTNLSFDGDYTADISVDVTERQESAASPVTASQGLDFDALTILYDAQFYVDQAACEKAFENQISHLPRLQEQIAIVKTLPDPPSEQTLGRVLEATAAIRQVVEEVAERDPAHAIQLAQYVAVTLRVPAKIFLRTEEY
jgi:hypothetical protein